MERSSADCLNIFYNLKKESIRLRMRAARRQRAARNQRKKRRFFRLRISPPKAIARLFSLRKVNKQKDQYNIDNIYIVLFF